MGKILPKLLIFLFIISFIGYKEYAAPYWRYHINDWFSKSRPALKAELKNGLSLKLYSSNKPYVGKIAGLQKGLILSQNGMALIGEGYGFGMPLIVVKGKSWVASKAKTGRFVHGDTTILSKQYFFDTRENDVNFPRRRYTPTASIGNIRIDYVIFENSIEVNADMRGLVDVDYQYIYFMNEQSGRHFRYGLNAVGRKIDLIQWQAPLPMATLGIHAPRMGVTFWVKDKMETLKYLGRETLARWHWWGHESTNWAGCDLRLENKLPTFKYTITIDKVSQN